MEVVLLLAVFHRSDVVPGFHLGLTLSSKLQSNRLKRQYQNEGLYDQRRACRRRKDSITDCNVMDKRGVERQCDGLGCV